MYQHFTTLTSHGKHFYSPQFRCEETEAHSSYIISHVTKVVSHQAVIWTWQSGSRIFILNHYDKLPPVMKDKRMCVNGRTEGFLDWDRIQSNPCPGHSWPAAVLFPIACGLLYLPSRLHTASEWSSLNANLILPLPPNLPSVPWCPQDKRSHPMLMLEALCGLCPPPPLASPPNEPCIRPCDYVSQSCWFLDWGDRVIVRIKLKNQYKMLRTEPTMYNCSINVSTVLFIYFWLSCWNCFTQNIAYS